MQPSYYYTKPGPPAKWNMAVKLTKPTHNVKNKSQRVECEVRYCLHCGSEIQRRPTEAPAQYNIRRFCSQSHKSLYHKNGGSK